MPKALIVEENILNVNPLACLAGLVVSLYPGDGVLQFFILPGPHVVQVV